MVTRINNTNCLAKALYDNVAEAPDELAFRKGDILTVLEQNTNSLEGWWLCSLRGRQGIVPGNRLRLLPGMYDPTGLGNGGTPQTEDPLHALRRSWTSNPNKVVTPQKVGAVYLYDVPVGTKVGEKADVMRTPSFPLRYPYPGCNSVLDVHGGSYDTPPSPRAVRNNCSGTYDEPRSYPLCSSPLLPASTYDSPRPNAPLITDGMPAHDYDVPTGDNLSTYDVPKSTEKEILNNVSHIITITDNYDTPQHLHKNSPPIYDGRAFSRSSGDTSTSSSFRSPSGSHSSMETLSLSSVSGSNRSSLEQHPSELYDIPPEPHPVLQPGRVFNAVPYSNSLLQETYDVPMNNALASQLYDSPICPRPVRALFEGAYDVPPQVTRDASPIPNADVVDSLTKLTLSPMADSLDAKHQDFLSECSELPLELGSAVEMLVKYNHEVQASISKLFSFVCATWRKVENIETKITDLNATCRKVQSSLFDFLNFAQGAVANSVHADDKTLCLKLCKLVKPLRDYCLLIKACVQKLDDKGWTVQTLACDVELLYPDALDQLVACAQKLVEDVRVIASCIQGNSALLFRGHPAIESKNGVKPPVAPKPDLKTKSPISGKKVQERPLPPTPAGLLKNQLCNKDNMNEYDYVNLESKETVERENEAIKANLTKDMCQSFDELVKQSEVPVLSHVQDFRHTADEKCTSVLDPKDLQLLHFYGEQIETHITHLTNAIDAFLLTIKNNQPPKVFVGHSKFIIISAHKIVFIGDTVHRNICSPDLKSRAMQNSNELCDSLKTLVSTTKKAASEFPSVVAVQEMVDSVVDVSHLANILKISVTSLAKG